MSEIPCESCAVGRDHRFFVPHFSRPYVPGATRQTNANLAAKYDTAQQHVRPAKKNGGCRENSGIIPMLACLCCFAPRVQDWEQQEAEGGAAEDAANDDSGQRSLHLGA